jgi:hypothetical protein
MRRSFCVAILIVLIFSAKGAFAAGGNWYVHKGASGSNNGTSWTNAWNEMNQINFSSVACGDTIWLAGGTYTTTLSVSKSCTAGSPLTINKVRSTDSVPVASPGWSSAFDSQVEILNANINVPSGAYITIDGRVGTPAANNFGIQVQCGPSTNGCYGVQGASSGNVSHVSFYYIELYGPSCVGSGPGDGSCTSSADGLNIVSGSNSIDSVLFDHGWIHRWAEAIRTSNWSNGIIQYTMINQVFTTPSEHNDIVYNYANINFTMRYNEIHTSPNDGIFFDFGGTTNFQFYGNVYYHSGGALISFKQGYSFGTAYIYNNVFENDGTFGDYQPGWLNFRGSMSGGAVENNVFENVGVQGTLPGTADYNAWSTSVGKQDSGAHSFTYNPGSLGSSILFVNESPSNPIAANFHLTSTGATTLQNGVSLSAPFNQDPDGNARGANGHWYIGAFQYGGSSGSGSAPQPPTGLTIWVQ